MIDPLLIFCVGVACLTLGILIGRYDLRYERRKQAKEVSYPGLYLAWSKKERKS